MPGLYWDTSALVKHYHPEVGTPKVDTLLQTPGSQHIISRLDGSPVKYSFRKEIGDSLRISCAGS